MSANEPHLEVYNPKPRVPETHFPQFTRLPLDVRLCIWDYALPKERFVRARLSVEKCAKREAPDDSGQASESYQVTLEGRKLISKFLHVCQEARAAALRFYRVRMPCRYEHVGNAKDGTFYFNPEHDILKLSVNGRKDYSHTIQFFKNLQSADPKGVGLQNLAIDLDGVKRLASFQLGAMMPDARETLTSTLSKLRRVYLLCLETTGRMFLGPLNGVRAITGFEMHRSRPVLGSVPAFQRIAVDPRPVEKDLKRTFMGNRDPLKLMYAWKRLLKLYGIAERSDLEYSFMVSCSPKGPAASITDRESAEQWIAQEDARWRSGVEEWDQRLRPGNVEREKPEDLCNAPQTAVGFWLFPIQALGQLPSDEKRAEDVEREFEPKRVADLSEYRPQLGLMEIS